MEQTWVRGKTIRSAARLDAGWIAAIGFEDGTLRVIFRSGRAYDHPGVPYSVYVEFMNATSMGAYYARHIRGKYK